MGTQVQLGKNAGKTQFLMNACGKRGYFGGFFLLQSDSGTRWHSFLTRRNAKTRGSGQRSWQALATRRSRAVSLSGSDDAREAVFGDEAYGRVLFQPGRELAEAFRLKVQELDTDAAAAAQALGPAGQAPSFQMS